MGGSGPRRPRRARLFALGALLMTGACSVAPPMPDPPPGHPASTETVELPAPPPPGALRGGMPPSEQAPPPEALPAAPRGHREGHR
jgi:hypothetical protein